MTAEVAWKLIFYYVSVFVLKLALLRGRIKIKIGLVKK